jgi:hypothetical protein
MPGTVCGFFHCHNTTIKCRDKKFFKVPGIKRNQGPMDLETTTARRAAWLVVLNRQDLLDGSKNVDKILVCEDHFLESEYHEIFIVLVQNITDSRQKNPYNFIKFQRGQATFGTEQMLTGHHQ